nr:bifunctional folylpolyglutamate synthase/dihydrofolate synthase [candidate division Zixibacteria bacterium]
MSKDRGSYASALDFIMRRELFGIKLGLENIAGFLDRIGNPQNRFRSIHVAGTNGKGSTCAYIEAILRQAGYKTGIFTSPHLVDYRERIRIGGKQIDKKYVTDFVAKYRYVISRRHITFFEACTAMAFNYFADHKVDIAVVEVGLGGRLDATSTLTPLLSIITDISYDHTNILGDTLTKIAYEKAGIIKPGIPILTGVMKAEPLAEITRVSQERGAPLLCLKKNAFIENGQPFRFDYKFNDLTLKNLEPSLAGNHQIRNAALAVAAADMLLPMGFNLRSRDIRIGLNKAVWPGRFQKLKRPGRPLIIMDVGHNPGGIKSLVDCFRKLYPGRRADIVIGFVKNKDLGKSVGFIKRIARRVEIARLNTHRTADPEEIAVYFEPWKDMTISDSVVNSARKLVESSGPDDIIIICGSHYAVGDFMANQNKIL